MAKNTTSIELILQDSQVVQATSRINAALASVEASSKRLAETGFDKFAESVKGFIENPLQSAGAMAENLLKSLGPLGTGVAAVGGIVALAGKASFDFAEQLGQLGHQIQDTALRTGLTTKEVSEFRFAAQIAGKDIGIFEGLMRKLSQGLADTGDQGKRAREGLSDLSVTTRDAYGNLRGTSDILLQISEGLKGQPNAWERNAVALKLFGRAGIEAIPVMTELAESVRRAQELGLGISDADNARFNDYHRQLVEIGAQWDVLKREFEKPLAATVLIVIKRISDVFGLGESEFKLGEDSGNKSAEALALQRAAALNQSKLSVGLAAAGALRTAEADDYIKRMLGRYSGTEAGAEEQYKSAVGAAGSAEANFRALSGSGVEISAAQKAYREWQDAEAAALKYKAALDAIKSGTFVYKEKPDKPGGIPIPSLYGPTFGGQDFAVSLTTGGEDYNQWNAGMDAATKGQTRAYMEASYAAGRKADEEHLRMVREATSSEVRMIELLAGPGGEVSAIEKIYQLRLQESATKEEAQKAELAHAEQLAELDRKRMEAFKQGTMQAFDALVSGGTAGLQNFARSFLLNTARTVVGNAAEIAYSHVSGLLSLPGQGTADNPSLLGKLLGGTAFSSDPSKSLNTSALQLTGAAVALKGAASALSAVRAGGGGMYGGGYQGGMVFSGMPSSGGGGVMGPDSVPGYTGSGIPPSVLDDILGGGSGTSPQSWDGGTSANAVWGPMFNPDASNSSRVMSGVATAGVLYAGYHGISSGIKQGGAKGTLGAVSAGLGTAAALDPEPVSKAALAISALVTAAVATILKDPKKARDEAITAELQNRRFSMPSSTTMDIDMQGRHLGYNSSGMLVHITINALDARSVLDRANDISAAVAIGLRTHTPLIRGIQLAAGTRGF